MLRQGKNEENIVAAAELDIRTVRKVLRGGPVQWSTVKAILESLGIKDFSPFVLPQAEAVENESRKIGEWKVEQALTPIITATNGLQYRIYRLTHLHQPERIGRGKRYEFLHLSDDAQATIKELLIRHPKVCDRVGAHAHLPVCYGTFPEPSTPAWWVVDRWVEGKSLDEILSHGEPVSPTTLRELASQSASALSALHKAGIIRRDLSPSTVFLSGDNAHILLTDFELAKLLDGSPSVSRDWPVSTYRAPEVGESDVDERADIFSWGRVIIHAALGTLPVAGVEADSLAKVKLPARIRELLISATKARKSQRPETMAEVLAVIERWK